MDKNGFFNFGIHNSVSYAQIKSAQYTVVEVNENIPLALGGAREQVHISEVDFIIESENEPMFELPAIEATEVDRKIAEHVFGAHYRWQLYPIGNRFDAQLARQTDQRY
jgi:acyl-CoA hydrolase